MFAGRLKVVLRFYALLVSRAHPLRYHDAVLAMVTCRLAGHIVLHYMNHTAAIL